MFETINMNYCASLFKYLVIIAVLCPILLMAQTRIDTIKTDSSTIERIYSEYGNTLSMFNRLIKVNKCYYSDYYLDSKKLKQKGLYINHNTVGLWQVFDSDGKLVREIDYDKRSIPFFNKKIYPFLACQNRAKLKGDSIVESYYGIAFRENNVKWDIDGSAVYNGDAGSNWTDSLVAKPTAFLLRYDVNAGDKCYSDIIEFEIDSTGKFIADQDISGLEKLPAGTRAVIRLTTEKAINLAKIEGLNENDTSKAQAFMAWEKGLSKDQPDGHIRIFVIIKTGTIKHLNPKGRSAIITKYDEYVFNPWTEEYIGKRKVKSIYAYEKRSGSSTGLLPDE